MIDVFFGESRTYISDTLMQKLGWKRGERVSCDEAEPGLYRLLSVGGGWRVYLDSGDEAADRVIRARDRKYCFGWAIPGVSRGKLNGARGVVGKVENGVLVIDVRDLLSPVNA